ncbi:MAG: ribosome-associated translation inhibitor RaiA [Clostridia bacterium]|nr:ribosome-associated translation inhibitor RaiA [Clostridia bacterium]
MNIKITGRDIKATEAIKDYLERKMDRVQKYFDDDVDVSLTIKAEGNKQIAEIGTQVKGSMFRAVTEDRDLYASIDKDIDILEGQIRKWKTKRDRLNKEDSIKMQNVLNNVDNHSQVENEIIKTLYYELKPMHPDDAKLKLQEKSQNQFLTFINVETNKVNVIYKLKDGINYGLVEPEN